MNEKLIDEILDKHLEYGLRGDIKLHEPHTYNHIRNAMIEYKAKDKNLAQPDVSGQICPMCESSNISTNVGTGDKTCYECGFSGQILY